MPPIALLDNYKPGKIANTLYLLLVGPLSVSIYSAHLADQDGDDEAYEDGEDEAYEDGEDDLASDAAGVQKEARSSEAAHSRGRTATLVWSGLAGWGTHFRDFKLPSIEESIEAIWKNTFLSSKDLLSRTSSTAMSTKKSSVPP